MDLLQSYPDNEIAESPPQNLNSQFSDQNPSPDSSPIRMLPSKSTAPKVDDTMLALAITGEAARAQSKPLDPTQHLVGFNSMYEQLWAPIYDSAHPYTKDGLAQGLRNHKLGFVEDASIESFVFDEQYNTFQKYEYAIDPSQNSFIDDLEK
ncbi:hypothetical protein H5410_025392 [Solanum commersonii]|uniref:Uncharacterized protein n=1 Tax=Solanum commersonii TaxID=4109 RepID=A0A9J5YXT8_SOLCO|nr:hypothetical protein H5410_025392 [Solanum commersonii]